MIYNERFSDREFNAYIQQEINKLSEKIVNLVKSSDAIDVGIQEAEKSHAFIRLQVREITHLLIEKERKRLNTPFLILLYQDICKYISNLFITDNFWRMYDNISTTTTTGVGETVFAQPGTYTHNTGRNRSSGSRIRRK